MRTKSNTLLLILLGLFCIGCIEPENNPTKEGVDYVAVRSELYSVSVPVPAKEAVQTSLTIEQQAYVKNGNDFAFRMLSQLYGKNVGSFVFSPLSVQYSLLAAANASQGETSAEILSFLGMGEDVSALNEYSRTLLEQLSAVDLDVKLQMANAMVMKEGYTVSESTKTAIEKNCYTPVVAISFRDAEGPSVVNEWFRQKTEGSLSDIFEYTSPQQTVCYLLGGLYYKAGWGVRFNGIVQDAVFNGIDGEQEIDYYLETTFAPIITRMDKFRVLGLNMSKGAYIFNIILPNEGEDLGFVLSYLSETIWSYAQRYKGGYAQTHIMIPAFSTESTYKLKALMEDNRIKLAFDGRSADFSPLVSEPGFFIDDVLHKAKLTVGKSGADDKDSYNPDVHALSYGLASQDEIEFIANKPFAYVITERSSGAIILAGVFSGSNS